MSEALRRLLVAYDVSDDRRRARVARLLAAFGERVQYSVFIVDGRAATFVRLRGDLISLVDMRVDRLLLCDLGPSSGRSASRMEVVGNAAPLIGDEPLVV